MVLVGKLGSVLASALYMPPIIGFLLAGFGMQDIISQGLIKGCASLGTKFLSEARTFALIVVLMRAGLTLKPREVLAKGAMTALLSVLPYFAEWAVMLGIGLAPPRVEARVGHVDDCRRGHARVLPRCAVALASHPRHDQDDRRAAVTGIHTANCLELGADRGA